MKSTNGSVESYRYYQKSYLSLYIDEVYLASYYETNNALYFVLPAEEKYLAYLTSYGNLRNYFEEDIYQKLEIYWEETSVGIFEGPHGEIFDFTHENPIFIEEEKSTSGNLVKVKYEFFDFDVEKNMKPFTNVEFAG